MTEEQLKEGAVRSLDIADALSLAIGREDQVAPIDPMALSAGLCLFLQRLRRVDPQNWPRHKTMIQSVLNEHWTDNDPRLESKE